MNLQAPIPTPMTSACCKYHLNKVNVLILKTSKMQVKITAMHDNKSNNLFVKFQLMQQFQFHVGVMLKVPKKPKKCGGLFQI